MGKADRLLLILNLLRSRGNLMASDLASECEVSERTIRRDIKTLSETNMTIYKDDGYRLLTADSVSALSFTVDELLSLYVGLSSNPVQSVERLSKSAKQALSKLESSIPEKTKVAYEKAKKHITVRPEKTRSHQGVALMFQLLSQAMWPEKKVRVRYASPYSSELIELVAKALLYKNGDWYLAGLTKKKIRYFRLDMIKEVSLS
jgi:predicted DNA-binding transcriptional regulator YafY